MISNGVIKYICNYRHKNSETCFDRHLNYYLDFQKHQM